MGLTMGEAEAIGEALSRVQALLDKLTAQGKHQEAFAIARAQFSASVRASWPANLSAVAAAIEKAIAEAGDSLSEEDRAELRGAAETLRKVPHP
jgi:hypothetical protein